MVPKYPRLAFPGILVAAVIAATGTPARAQDEPARPTPVIGLIIDDMGYRLHDGLRALELPGPLAYSVLPHSPSGAALALRAGQGGREVLLHLPMHAQEHNHLLGPGALMQGMSREQFLATLDSDLAAVPNVIGVSNHMGSLLTRQPQPMQWLMQALKARGNLFFVDSRTSGATVAGRVATEAGVPLLARDVFLDNEPDHDYIRGQFFRLVEKARFNGSAIGIAHPKPETIDVLADLLADLPQIGVKLVSLQELLAIQQRSQPPWQLSSSRSPRAAKN